MLESASRGGGSGPGGVSAPGGSDPGGLIWGVSNPGGVSAPRGEGEGEGGVLVGGVNPSMH